jgi:hypothetical protein
MNMLGYEATVRALRDQGVPEAKALKFAREQWPEVAAQQDAAALKAESRREKDVEHAGDNLMQAHGFTVVRFSQPRASKQTAGIPDRRYYRAELGRSSGIGGVVFSNPHALWWEAKAANGKQSPAQREFQTMAEECGETYLVGTEAVLRDYLARAGLLR